jgi:hypothetical protein
LEGAHKQLLLAFDVSLVLAGKFTLYARSHRGLPHVRNVHRLSRAASRSGSSFATIRPSFNLHVHKQLALEGTAHLLGEQKYSGEVWQMLCHKESDDQVEFSARFIVYGFDGKARRFLCLSPRITLGTLKQGHRLTENK